MFKINRKLEYALIALKYMISKPADNLTSAKEICQTYGTPFDATSRALQIMTGNSILKSEQGVRGGYQIAKDLGRVNFFEFVEMIEGGFQMTHCLHDDEDAVCDLQSTCNIISPITRLNEQLKNFCSNLSLLDLLQSPDPDTRQKVERGIAV